MRISQLSELTGVPVATIKYYLREGLLSSGTLTAATQAQYNESHVARLQLIRALVGPARLSIDVTKQILALIDHPPRQMLKLLRLVAHSISATSGEDADLHQARELIQHWGWRIDAGDRATLGPLANALAALDAAQFELPDGMLDRYAETMHDLATAEIDHLPRDSRQAVRYVVLGTVLVEPLLLALRRLAEQDVSVRRFG